MVFFHQDPAKARTVDQIEGLLFIRKELQGGVFGVIHYVPRFVQGKIHLPEQSRGNIHRPAEPAQFLFFRQQRLLVHAHSYPSVRLIEEDRFLTTPSYYIYHTQERRSSQCGLSAAATLFILSALLKYHRADLRDLLFHPRRRPAHRHAFGFYPYLGL